MIHLQNEDRLFWGDKLIKVEELISQRERKAPWQDFGAAICTFAFVLVMFAIMAATQ